METQFLGVPGVDALLFFGLTAASMCTSFIGVVTGTAGGLLLLALMAMVFPPAVLIPVHTVIQMGSGGSRAIIMRRYIMRETVLPFTLGCIVGAVAGAQVFVTLPTNALLGIIGAAIVLFTWMPKIARVGSTRNRFAVIGFGATFLGMFVSSTGTMTSPFIASAAPDRRNHVATFSALMTIVHIAKLVAFSILGVAFAAYLPLIAAMIAAGVLGNWIGCKVLVRIPERAFRIVLQVLLTVLALRLMWKAASDAGIF